MNSESTPIFQTETREKMARFLVVTHLFLFCTLALIYRNLILIAVAYSATIVIFFTSPYKKLLQDKDIRTHFAAFHAGIFILAALVWFYPTPATKVCCAVAVIVLINFTLYRKRKNITALL